MATQLFLRAPQDDPADVHRGTNTARRNGVASGWLTAAISLTRGANAQTNLTTNTVAGTTVGIELTNGAGGTPVEWISPPVAADVTISGTITANIWCAENSMNANVAINVIIDIIRAATFGADGSNAIQNIVQSTFATEMALSTRAANNFTTGMTSGAYTAQTLNRGDRLRIRIIGDDAGTMATGFTFSASMGGPTAAADGDTYVTFTETITFEAAPSGTQLFLTNEQSGLTYGTPVAPTLISDFTGSDENPLSEGGNWAALNSSSAALRRTSNTAGNVGSSYWTPANFGPDLEAYVTIAATGATGQSGIVVRVQEEGGAATWDGYLIGMSSTVSGVIYKVTNTGTTLLTLGAAAWAAGDKLGVKIVGSTIQCWRLPSGGSTWQLVCAVTDTVWPSAGKIGLLSASNTVFYDDFYAGTDTNLFTADAPALISNFTGADENPLSEGGNWAQLNSASNDLQRISNAITSTSAGGQGSSYWTSGNFGPDLEAYITIPTSGTAAGIIGRIQGEGGSATWDGYEVIAVGTQTQIAVITNGTATILLQPTPVTWASGDKLGMRLEGSTIQAWRQASGSSVWNLVVTAVDNTYTGAGKIGLLCTGNTIRIDDFYAATNSNLFTQQAWTSRGAGVISYQSDTDAGWL